MCLLTLSRKKERLCLNKLYGSCIFQAAAFFCLHKIFAVSGGNMKDKLLNEICKSKNYSDAYNSYSPFLSDIGLQIDENLYGVGDLYLHYNRVSRRIFKNAIKFDRKPDHSLSSLQKIVFENNEALLAFYKNNAFLFESSLDKIELFSKKGEKTVVLPVKRNGDFVYFSGYSENCDERDPDKYVPYVCGVRIICGEYSDNVVYSRNEKIMFAVCFQTLDIDYKKLNEVLFYSPKSVDEAAALCKKQIEDSLIDLDYNSFLEKDYPLISKAVRGLLFNNALCPGKLKNHITSFPNRGGYPVHFIWDTVFQNLAFNLMNIKTSKDCLLQIIDNQRSDGKYPQFMCSTWDRPHEAQPALIGYAFETIVKSEKEKLKCNEEDWSSIDENNDFEMKVFRSLEKNNFWWLTQRMTDIGLIYSLSGFETGQDNSPRFDNGESISVDMNSYLLQQIKVTTHIASKYGLSEKEKYWQNEAKALEINMMKYLFDEEYCLFFDLNLKTREKIKLISPVCFLPIWAGISIDSKAKKYMIENYLLNEEYFFSEFPFPSVAYNENCYKSSDWWRGPIWMSEAFLMLDILKNEGYNEKYKEAVKKLYEIISNNKEMSELFDSKKGKGLGFKPQGWTCAVFIVLCKILSEM